MEKMKTKDYPNIELCRKLTDLGFPTTEKVFTSQMKAYNGEPPSPTWEMIIADEKYNVWYVCPNLMEMFNVTMNQNRSWYIRISKNRDTDGYIWADCDFYIGSILEKRFIMDNIPDAISEMIIWLKENDFIYF